MDSKPRTVKIGVFIPSETQVLDLACVDVFAMMSHQYLSVLPMVPSRITQLAPIVDIFYITAPETGFMVPMSASMTIRATHDISHPEVQPGKLDIVLVPGPDPAATWSKAVTDFLHGHFICEKTDVLSVCTGIFLCGAAGLLEDRTVCGPRGLQDVLRKKYPKAQFVGEKLRWVQDGNLWTSGGITNGNDLAAAYARSSKHFPRAIADLACTMADVGDRPQTYDEGQTRFFLGVLWIFMKGFFTKKE
ncbi:Isonitrile hydratase [Paramyrothecium foliicola]|nr:Isonitrile hydratase [Paramyrothecium foliicola]